MEQHLWHCFMERIQIRNKKCQQISCERDVRVTWHEDVIDVCRSFMSRLGQSINNRRQEKQEASIEGNVQQILLLKKRQTQITMVMRKWNKLEKFISGSKVWLTRSPGTLLDTV